MYIPPASSKYHTKQYCQCLDDVLDAANNLKIRNMCANVTSFMVGDFNAHVGTLSCGKFDEEDCVRKCSNWFLNKIRFSRFSSKIDPRGCSINRFCNDNNYFMLNGRCNGDAIGKSTYQVGTGERVHTVIDFVLCDRAYDVDMYLVDDFNCFGGHAAIVASCIVNKPS